MAVGESTTPKRGPRPPAEREVAFCVLCHRGYTYRMPGDEADKTWCFRCRQQLRREGRLEPRKSKKPSEAIKAHRAEYRRMEEVKARLAARKQLPEWMVQEKARIALRNAVKRGDVKKLPCKWCGAIKAQAHHEDYSKPLEVIWLCPSCHGQRHAEIRRMKDEFYKKHNQFNASKRAKI